MVGCFEKVLVFFQVVCLRYIYVETSIFNQLVKMMTACVQWLSTYLVLNPWVTKYDVLNQDLGITSSLRVGHLLGGG
jgi:hypothetical protein